MLARAVLVLVFLAPACEWTCVADALAAEPPMSLAESAHVALVNVCGLTRVRALGNRNHRGSVQRSMARESTRYRIPVQYLAAVIAKESTCDPDARGKRGEVGLMQVLPTGSAARGTNGLALEEYATNIHAGARHLRRCLDMCVDLKGAFGVYSGRRTCRAGRASTYARRTFELVLQAEGKRS